MRGFKFILSTAALVFAFNYADAQNFDGAESAGLLSSTSTETTALTANEEAKEQVKVWPEVSSIKIMVEVDKIEEVNIYSCTGRLVKTQKVDKGEGINIETLMPGAYTVKVGNKVGSFTKK
jgi:hypothetical protein